MDFQAHLVDRDQTAQDFFKELKTLQQIQSYNAPNVNKIYEILEVYSQFWIISEYCPGGSVHTLVSIPVPIADRHSKKMVNPHGTWRSMLTLCRCKQPTTR